LLCGVLPGEVTGVDQVERVVEDPTELVGRNDER
jgi:hypothetical protein